MSLLEYALFALSSLFVIIDPIAVIPSFVAMTEQDSPASRERTARMACLLAFGILVAFAAAGSTIFRLFGITLPAFQIAGSIVLMLVALDMVRAKRSEVKETKEEEVEGVAKHEVAITPLGVPMLAGPGAISTAILLESQTTGPAQLTILYLAMAVAFATSYLVLRFASVGAQKLGPTAIKVSTRLMGLILGAIAVQFMLNALKVVIKDLAN